MKTSSVFLPIADRFMAWRYHSGQHFATLADMKTLAKLQFAKPHSLERLAEEPRHYLSCRKCQRRFTVVEVSGRACFMRVDDAERAVRELRGDDR